MKYIILFKENIDEVSKGEKQAIYDSFKEAEDDAERITATLNEISDERVSYEIVPSENPDDMMLPSKSGRYRPSYTYYYSEEIHEEGFHGLTTYKVPDLNITITTEYAIGLSVLKEAVRLQLEDMVNNYEIEERNFPVKKEIQCHEGIRTGIITVSLNPIIERRKKELGME